MTGNSDEPDKPSVDFDEPLSVAPIRVLGHGRAAEARLVQAEFASGRSHVCVEKVFRPGLLTRIIYQTAFQAPFGYQFSRDAILSCFYRRRVAASLIEIVGLNLRVSRPLYVRFDAESKAFVLGAEWIDGRGILPVEADRFRVRRFLSKVFRHRTKVPPKPPQEIEELLGVMRQLEQLFCDTGLAGTGWQVCTRAMVSTANLLRTDSGYVAIDLESGIPAVLVPRYLWHSLRLRSFPMFDDVDETGLRAWIDNHSVRISERIGRKKLRELCDDVEKLIAHTTAWKQAEPALGRNGLKIFSRKTRQASAARCLEIWRLRGDVDTETVLKIRSGCNGLYRCVYTLGLVPGRAGRFLQRLVGHRAFRNKVKRFVSETEFRRKQIDEYIAQKTSHWIKAGRLTHGRDLSKRLVIFGLHWLLALCTPRGMHRWLTDADVRRNSRAQAFLMIVSGRFQRAYGQHLIHIAIEDWERCGRLSHDEAEVLRDQSDSSKLQEYAQCFGLHLGLKLFDPLVYPIKIAGITAFVTTGNPLYLLTLLVLPTLRTLITLSRMLSRHRDPFTEYGEALIIGAIPTVGSLAFPVQISASCPELSTFLLRDAAARAGRALPIYGGKDSRIEIGAIRLMDFAIETIDIVSNTTSAIRRRFLSSTAGKAEPPQLLRLPDQTWDGLVDEQLRLLAIPEVAAQSDQPSVAPLQTPHRKAA